MSALILWFSATTVCALLRDNCVDDALTALVSVFESNIEASQLPNYYVTMLIR